MNLRQLKIFLTVCQEGSMSKAAKKLCMTQPSIT
ncbi:MULTISPECIES: LysR family transcriptional regulator [Thermoanaerobacter]